MFTPDVAPQVTIDALFTGTLAVLENDGATTGLYKQPVNAPRWLGAQGIAGDVQADRKHHGGPQRALNHYPAEHYAYWQGVFTNRKDAFVPGVLGENISTTGLTEADVGVGDVFTLGQATIQIAQPRQPCWKIARRLDVPKLARDVATSGRSGWLYRVLEPGFIAPGDTLERVERAAHGISLAEIWRLQATHRPDADQIEQLALLAGLDALAPSWRQRLASRQQQLKENG